MFTGEKRIESATSTVAYHLGLQPKEYLLLAKDCVVLLDRCVAAGRGHAGDASDKKKNASLNLALGLGMMTMSESRAAIALVSLGLERSARIHFRSLHEYAVRARLLLDSSETAHDFKIAAAREMQKYAIWMKIDSARVTAANTRYLADAEPGEQPKKEKDALGGSMELIMRRMTGDDATYASTFGWPSLFSHGSILALYEVSEATNGRGEDFATGIFRDGLGATMLLDIATKTQEMSLLLIKHFGVDVLDEWDSLHERLVGIAKRDNHVP